MDKREQLTVIPQTELEHFKQLASRVDFVLRKLEDMNFSDSYIESKKIPGLLGISKKTWQNWRDNRSIPFIQIGAKIWIKRSDLDSFFNDHYVKSKN